MGTGRGVYGNGAVARVPRHSTIGAHGGSAPPSIPGGKNGMNAIQAAAEEEPLDVVIVGAGLSGIGAASYLSSELPRKSYAILEARGDLGGTWDLFRYPGIRSDSDLFTFGYEFKPWRSDKAIAGAADILAYLREAAAECGADRRIRYHHKVLRADWDSATALWTVTVRRSDIDAEISIRARWLFSATGYYDYDEGYSPPFEGAETFRGPLIHPQHWPAGFDHAGKRIAVIGSGATAVTLVPALAQTAVHVTQIQRTPTYVMALPSSDWLANLFRRILPEARAHAAARKANVLRQRWFWLLCRSHPRLARRLIRWSNRRMLPKDYPVDVHFNPPYDPWDQRLCVVPDGDLFKAIRRGSASIVTGAIERITETGVLMASGEEIAADAIVTATGLNIQLFGGAELFVDGRRVEPAERLVFKGMMLDGVPNFCFAVGYTNSSWTLKVGLLCRSFCRLLALMDAEGHAVCVAERPSGGIATRPLLDFGAGYVKRALDTLPRQGDRAPWEMTFNYIEDARMVGRGEIKDPALRFSPPPAASAGAGHGAKSRETAT